MGELDVSRDTSRRTNFVGRGRELAELSAALDSASDSDTRLFLISGEPGIGKTRLAGELAAHARARDVRVVWGRCWEGDGAPAYWPWIQVLRAALNEVEPEKRRALFESEVTPHIAHDVAQIVPELRSSLLEAPRSSATPQLDPEGARFRLFDSVTNLLKNFALSKPMLIVLDDLHDADQASMRMLRFVARQIVGSRIVVVATYRDVEVRRSPALGKLIGDLSREARLVPLVGLSEGEVAELVKSIAGQVPDTKLVSRLYAATDGNPLFVDGIVRTLIAETDGSVEGRADRPFRIPSGLRQAIRNRLALLSRPVNSILSVAAVIGNEFEVDRCLLVTSISAEQVNSLLDKAAQADIVRALGHGRYRFSHALIREALYTEMDTNSRLRLHRRIGEVMEEIHSSDPGPHLAELAHHFGEARVANKAIDYMTRAGKAAEAIYAYGEATHWYSSAIQAIERRGPANPATELEVLLALARAHFHGGSFPACKEAFARAAEVARGLRAWDSFASAVLGLTGHPQDALVRQPDSKLLALVEEALAMHREDDSLRSMLLSRLAVETHLRGEHSSAESLFGQAIDMARSIGDRNALFNALNSRAFFRVFGPEGDELRELTATAREASDPDAFWLGFSWEFRLHVTMGNVEAIDTSIEEYSLIADKSRLPGFQSVRSAVLGMRALMAGRLREGERFCEEAMRILEPWERLDPGQMFPLILALRREEGRLDEMASLAHRASEMFPSFLFGRASHAQLLLETGGEADARVAFEQLAINNFGDVPPDTNWLPTLALLADVCARLRDLRRAGILYHLLLPHAGRNAHFLILTCYGPISHYLGMLAATLSHYEEAEQHFRSALEFTSRMKAHLLTAYAQRDYASMLLERGGPGDRQKALALLGDTVRMAQTLGLKRLSAELKTLEHAGAAGSDFETPASGRVGNVSEAHLHPKAGELPNHIFRREGEIWTIVHGAMTTRLRDAKGLGYLAYLLAHPGERIHVLDLVTMVEGGAAAEGSAARPRARGQADDIETVRGLGDAGPALDLRARAEYKRRLGELHAELEEAEGFNDAGHAERIRGEIEFLGAELSAAVGIGGRGRKTAAHAERTRQTVSKSIRAIIKKIRHRDRSLGHHLGTCIKTGYFCAYLPEPDRRIDWHF